MAHTEKRITRLDYCQYLLSTQTNYTLTNYAEHCATLSHDLVNRYLREEKLTARLIWEQVLPDIIRTESGYLLFDDTVLDKRYSQSIEGVRWQYSGNAHQIIRGVGLVNCIYVNPQTHQFWLIDYRVFDPERDGKGKIDHVLDMLRNAIHHKRLPFRCVLMDTWYATNKLMLQIHDEGKLFYCPVRSNRLGKDDPTAKIYTPLKQLAWTEPELQQGKKIRLRGMPREFSMKMFRVTVSPHRTDYVVTNDPSQTCANDTQQVCGIRWLIEQFHREVKQLTGIERCQCRKLRIVRNHISCAIAVWTRLKQLAYQTGQTVYEIKNSLLRDYLIQQLKQPSVKMSFA
jgi:SRSO17 transposase